MTAGERFKGWIEGLTEAWGDRLRGWMASWLEKGVTNFMDSMEPTAQENIRGTLSQIKEHPSTPQGIKDLIDRVLGPSHAIHLAILIPLAIFMMLPMVTSMVQPLGNLIRYGQERLFYSGRIDPLTAIRAHFRKIISDEELENTLKDFGFNDQDRKALYDVTHFYPAPADLVRWQAREVFEPEMIRKYGLDSELGAIEREPFYKAGMTEEQITNFWRAHWEHASWMQIVEMLHRGLVTESDVYDWFRLVEIPPFWRDLLTKTAYTWPTRVDVRRWWDMRTIDETELRRLYSGMGYRGVNLDNYVLWTKVYVAFPDLMARWTNGWITEEDVRSELIELGMPEARVEEMIQGKKKAVEAEQVEDGKTLTKTEIYKGVKLDRLTWEQGIDLLMDLNLTSAQADYLLDINVGALEGSPETYEEFKRLTSKYKKAIGKGETAMPEEIVSAGAELVQLTKDVADLTMAVEEERKQVIGAEVIPPEAEAKLKSLQVKLHRAQAKLARAQTDYDIKVAEWRYGTK